MSAKNPNELSVPVGFYLGKGCTPPIDNRSITDRVAELETFYNLNRDNKSADMLKELVATLFVNFGPDGRHAKLLEKGEEDKPLMCLIRVLEHYMKAAGLTKLGQTQK